MRFLPHCHVAGDAGCTRTFLGEVCAVLQSSISAPKPDVAAPLSPMTSIVSNLRNVAPQHPPSLLLSVMALVPHSNRSFHSGHPRRFFPPLPMKPRLLFPPRLRRLYHQGNALPLSRASNSTATTYVLFSDVLRTYFPICLVELL